MSALATHRAAVSPEEYLSNPKYARSEFVNGEVVEKPMGNKDHNRLQVRFAAQLDAYASARGLYVGSELHSKLIVGDGLSYRVPDLGMTEEDSFDNSKHHIGGPKLVIEIRSPEDRTKDLLSKTEEYFANGTQMVWIVDPASKNVMVFAPGRVPWVVELGETLTGAPAFPDLNVNLEMVFKGV